MLPSPPKNPQSRPPTIRCPPPPHTCRFPTLCHLIELTPPPSQILDKKDLTPAAKYLSAGRQLAYAGYLTFDTLGFLGSTGMLEAATQKKFQRYAQKLWFSGIALSLF